MSQSPCVIPISIQSKKGAHYASNCFSITIRDGCGTDLGVKSHSDVVDWIKSNALYYVISIEKTGNASHFQMGTLFSSPVRQDFLRSKILEIYEPLNWTKEQKKHAVKVHHHHDARILFAYCVKEVDPLYYEFPLSLERIRGCKCPDWTLGRKGICRGCDPFRTQFSSEPESRFRWKNLWTKTELFPEQFFETLDRPEYAFMKPFYEGYFPWQSVVL